MRGEKGDHHPVEETIGLKRRERSFGWNHENINLNGSLDCFD